MPGVPYVPGTGWVPTSGISIADDSDPASTAVLASTDEAALDRTEQFTMTKLIPLGSLPFTTGASHFALEGTRQSLVTSTAAGDQAVFVLPGHLLVHGATLTQIDLLFVPTTGRAGLPFDAPKLAIARYALAAGAAPGSSTVIADDQAATGTLPTYENGQVKQLGVAVSHVIDAKAYVYQVVVDDESGANAVPGNRYFAIRLTYAT